jgi:hypothetical protein
MEHVDCYRSYVLRLYLYLLVKADCSLLQSVSDIVFWALAPGGQRLPDILWFIELQVTITHSCPRQRYSS